MKGQKKKEALKRLLLHEVERPGVPVLGGSSAEEHEGGREERGRDFCRKKKKSCDILSYWLSCSCAENCEEKEMTKGENERERNSRRRMFKQRERQRGGRRTTETPGWREEEAREEVLRLDEMKKSNEACCCFLFFLFLKLHSFLLNRRTRQFRPSQRDLDSSSFSSNTKTAKGRRA